MMMTSQDRTHAALCYSSDMINTDSFSSYPVRAWLNNINGTMVWLSITLTHYMNHLATHVKYRKMYWTNLWM